MAEQKQLQSHIKAIILISIILLAGTIAAYAGFAKGSQGQTLTFAADPNGDEQIRTARDLQRIGQFTDAAEILETQAYRGHPVALFYLAKAYGGGVGVSPDLDKSRELYLQAAQYDFELRGQTAYELGRLFLLSAGEDCGIIALEWFGKALDWNFTKAHFQLAKMYERGISIPQNIDLALQHYEAAASYGNEFAVIRLARIWRDGRYGLTPQPDKAWQLADRAVVLLRQKAIGGSASAAKMLGRLHRDGDFVMQDLDSAAAWFRRAAELEDPGAMHDLAMMQLARPDALDFQPVALDWLRRAAGMGHGGALTALGRFHLNEQYNLAQSEALSWLEKGVAAKHGGAMEELAALYAAGDLVPQDLQKAIELSRQGASIGHQGSKSLLERLIGNPTNDLQT